MWKLDTIPCSVTLPPSITQRTNCSSPYPDCRNDCSTSANVAAETSPPNVVGSPEEWPSASNGCTTGTLLSRFQKRPGHGDRKRSANLRIDRPRLFKGKITPYLWYITTQHETQVLTQTAIKNTCEPQDRRLPEIHLHTRTRWSDLNFDMFVVYCFACFFGVLVFFSGALLLGTLLTSHRRKPPMKAFSFEQVSTPSGRSLKSSALPPPIAT